MCESKNYNNLLALTIGAFIGLVAFFITFFGVGLSISSFVIIAIYLVVATGLLVVQGIIATSMEHKGNNCAYACDMYKYTKKTFLLVLVAIIIILLVLIMIGGLVAILFNTIILAIATFAFVTALIAFTLWIIYMIKYINKPHCCCE